MTRFEMELSGRLGESWKAQAELEISQMQKKADDGEILVEQDGAAYWKTSLNFLSSDCAEILSHTDFTFSPEATEKARDEQTREALKRYQSRTTAEDLMEMEAAFGKGTTVVNIITGEQIRL